MPFGNLGPTTLTETSGVVNINKDSLGRPLDELHSTHVMQVFNLGGGNVDVAVLGPAGVFYTVATGLTEGQVITVGPFGVTSLLTAARGPRGLWKAIKLTFNATGAEGKVAIESMATQSLV